MWPSQACHANANIILPETLCFSSEGNNITKLSSSVEVPKDFDLWGIVVDLKCFIGLQIWELFFYSCPLGLKESLDCSK